MSKQNFRNQYFWQGRHLEGRGGVETTFFGLRCKKCIKLLKIHFTVFLLVLSYVTGDMRINVLQRRS